MTPMPNPVERVAEGTSAKRNCESASRASEHCEPFT